MKALYVSLFLIRPLHSFTNHNLSSLLINLHKEPKINL